MAEAKKPEPKPKPKAGSTKQWYEEQLKKLKTAGKKKDWIILGSIAAVIIIVVIVASVVATRGDGDSGTVVESETSTTSALETTTTELEETSTTVMLESVSDGTYLVGEDIPAGVYKGEVIGGGAYWQISTDANGVDVVASENVTAQFYLEVEDGQFLKLHNVEISQ